MSNKKMNIFFVTSIYPNFDSGSNLYGTTFLYKYAKELINKGHKVTIIHMSRSYPKLFNIFANLLSRLGFHKYKKFIIPNNVQNTKTYVFEGIKVLRYNYLKIIPHTILSNRVAKKINNEINAYIANTDSPDVIISDFLDCGLPIINELAKTIKCPKMQIIHNSDYKYLNNKKIQNMFSSVDKWLFRSSPQKKELDKYISDYEYDYMYSGVDKDCLATNPKYRKKITNLLYVGKLIEIKGLDTILYALAKMTNCPLKLKVVGSGTDEEYYKDLVNNLKLSNIVEFVGQVEHKKVFDYMDNADAMILISHETFGMVYVEAMARGCIPIGAYNEGIDGVVKNGINGFLSTYGDYNELYSLFNNIIHMDSIKIEQLSKNAFKTASNMTDEKLANRLIELINKK